MPVLEFFQFYVLHRAGGGILEAAPAACTMAPSMIASAAVDWQDGVSAEKASVAGARRCGRLPDRSGKRCATSEEADEHASLTCALSMSSSSTASSVCSSPESHTAHLKMPPLPPSEHSYETSLHNRSAQDAIYDDDDADDAVISPYRKSRPDSPRPCGGRDAARAALIAQLRVWADASSPSPNFDYDKVESPHSLTEGCLELTPDSGRLTDRDVDEKTRKEMQDREAVKRLWASSAACPPEVSFGGGLANLSEAGGAANRATDASGRRMATYGLPRRRSLWVGDARFSGSSPGGRTVSCAALPAPNASTSRGRSPKDPATTSRRLPANASPPAKQTKEGPRAQDGTSDDDGLLDCNSPRVADRPERADFGARGMGNRSSASVMLQRRGSYRRSPSMSLVRRPSVQQSTRSNEPSKDPRSYSAQGGRCSVRDPSERCRDRDSCGASERRRKRTSKSSDHSRGSATCDGLASLDDDIGATRVTEIPAATPVV